MPRRASWLQTAGTSIGGAFIGGFLGHVLNPALTHLGVPPIADVAINSMSAAGGAAIGKRVSEVTHNAWASYDSAKRRDVIEKKCSVLIVALPRIPDYALADQLRKRIRDRLAEYHAGLLTTPQMEKKLEEIYDDYLIAVGEKPVSRKRS